MSFKQRVLPDLWIAAGLFLLPLLFFLPVTLGGRTLIPADNLYQFEPWVSARAEQGVPEIPHNSLLSDLILQNYQWKTFLRENIAAGDVPLWQPNQFAGTPFLANGQHSGLYPFSAIYYVLPLSSAYGWFTVSQLWLAGLWMYAFIRGLGLGRGAAGIGAVSYQLSSFFIVATVHPMIQAGAAWLPLILLMAEWLIQNRYKARLLWALIGAGALGMSFLAGHIEITYYTLLILSLYGGARLLADWLGKRQSLRGVVVAGLYVVLLVGLGFGLGAAQFIPMLETAGQSFRTERSELDEVRGYALPPRHVVLWLLPNAYGNPSHHTYPDVRGGDFALTRLDWERSGDSGETIRVTNTDFGTKNYVEGGAYIGILPLLLALIGVFAPAPRPDAPPYRPIFAGLGVLAVLFAFGTPAYALLYYLFPGIDQLHTPFRWIWVITFVLCVFAAYGVEGLRQRASDPAFARRVRWGIGLVGLAGIGLLAALGISLLFYDSFAGLIERIYTGLAGASLAFPDAESFYSYQFTNGAILGGALLLSALILSQFTRRFAPLLAVALIFADMLLAVGSFNPRANPAWLDYTPPAVAWLEARMAESEEPFRIQAFNWGEQPLNANAGWMFGLQDVRGYDSLFSKQYADYMGHITVQGGLSFNRIDPIQYDNPTALLNPRLNLLNVRYIITDWVIRPQEEFGVEDLSEVGLALVYEDAGIRIYENQNALPRAFLLEELLPLEDLTPQNFTRASITDYGNREVTLTVETSADNWLVLADSHAPGWRAFIRAADSEAEREIPVERVYENFRGVEVPPGEWVIRFNYNPASFQSGAFASFITGMLMIFLLLVWLWRRFVSDTGESDSGRRVIKNSLAPILLNLFNRGIDFAFAFIMLRILGPEGAGIYYYAIVIFGWFDILTNFGLNTLLTREVARDQSRARLYLVNTSLLRLGLAGLGIPLLVGVLAIRNATVTPALDETAVFAIVLLYLGLIPNSISTGLSALFYAFERAEYPAALTTISTLIKVSLGLGALLLGWGVVGLAAVSIITNLVTLVLMTLLARPLLPRAEKAERALSPPIMRGMMFEAWPLMLNHFLATIFFKIDVVLMEAINGVAIVGIYSTAYKWLDALNIIPAFFTMALLPMMARQAHEDKAALRRNYIFGFKALFMVALPITIMTVFIAPFLIGFLGGPEFLPEGGIALQIMILSIMVGWLNSLTQYVLIALDKQRLITRAFVVAVSFNIITNLIFLPAYSYRAAAITTIFSEIVLLIGFYWLLIPDLGHINFVRVLWRPVVGGAAMLGVMLLLWPLNGLLALSIGGMIYMGALLVLNPLTPEEAERIGRIIPASVQIRLRRLQDALPLFR